MCSWWSQHLSRVGDRAEWCWLWGMYDSCQWISPAGLYHHKHRANSAFHPTCCCTATPRGQLVTNFSRRLLDFWRRFCLHRIRKQESWSWSTNITDGQTDKQTDGQTTCDSKTALCTIVYRAVKNYYYKCFTAPWTLYGTTRVSRYQIGKINLDLLEQEIVSGSGISWAICKSFAPCPISDR